MSDPNTKIADYGESVSDYYWNITASWLWNTSFQNVEDSGWDPYLDFGDIASLTADIDPGDLSSYDFILSDQSCWDGEIQNCTSVCADPKLLFAPVKKNLSQQKTDLYLNTQVPYNILACMYYPLLSQLLSKANQSDASWNGLRSIEKQYNIVANASEDLIQDIVDTQVTCYLYYCSAQSEDLCDNFNPETWDYQALTAPGLLPLFPDWSTISPSSSMTINSDIGGIGVSIAYIMQFGIVILTWLSLRYLRLSRRYANRQPRGPQTQQTLLRKSPFRRFLFNLHEAFQQATPRIQTDLTEWMTEFHQTQCWFFIPLNLTVLIGIIGSTSVFGTKSLGQLARNMTYAQCVTQGSIVTTIATMYFVLFEVHFSEDPVKDETEPKGTGNSEALQSQHEPKHTIRELKKAFILWVLTFLSVSLGTAAWLLSFDISKPEHLLDATIGGPNTTWTANCSAISPATYNGERWTADEWTHKNHKSKRLPIIIWNWILLIAMFIYCLSPSHVWDRLPCLHRMSRDHATYRWARRTVLCLVEMAVLTCLGFFLGDYITVMRPNLPTIDKTFTMGQLLALFVWASTIVGAYYLTWDWRIEILNKYKDISVHQNYELVAYENHHKGANTRVWEVR